MEGGRKRGRTESSEFGSLVSQLTYIHVCTCIDIHLRYSKAWSVTKCAHVGIVAELEGSVELEVQW